MGGWSRLTGCLAEQTEFRENPAHVAASEVATDMMKWGKEQNSLTPGILPSCRAGTLCCDSALDSLGRLRPLALHKWNSQGCSRDSPVPEDR